MENETSAQPGGDQAPAGAWFPDPHDATMLRWWDGTQWTEHTHRPDSPAPSPGAPAPATSTTGSNQKIVLALVAAGAIAVVLFLTLGGDSESRIPLGGQESGQIAPGGENSYSFVAPGSGWYMVTARATPNSNLDTYLEVFHGGRSIAENDDYQGLGRDSRVHIRLDEGDVITIVVSGFWESAGSYTVSVDRDS